jgi:hypothetical protein
MAGSGNNLHIQLDETPFQLAQSTTGGLFATYDIDANALTLTKSTAAVSYAEPTFTLSDNVKTLNVNGATINAITTFPKLTAINVNEGATVTGAINAGSPGVTANVTGSGSIGGSTIGGNITATGNIEIKEKCDATAAAITSTGGNVTLNNSNVLKYNNNVSAKKDFSISGGSRATTVSVGRDATINIGAEDMAVSTKLAYTGDGKLNLFNGYVWEVDAANKTVGLYHGEKAGFTAIGKLSNGAKFAAKNVSIWNGNQPGYANFDTGGLNLTDKGTANQVWTATQLGRQLFTVASFNLMTDVDLDNKDWAGIVNNAAYTITGNGHTVSKVNLVGQQEGTGSKNPWRAGFIAHSEANITVNGLTLNGVKTTIKQLDESKLYLEGVGGLVGKVSSLTATATFKLVNVKLAADYFGSMSGTENKEAKYIGGFIGQTNAPTTDIIGCTVDLTGAILSGYYSLGGFIGQSRNAVNFMNDPHVGDTPETKCAVTGLTQMWVSNLDTSADNDVYQGQTGYYVGSAESTSFVTIEGAADVNPTFTVKGKVNLNKAFDVKTVSGVTYMFKYSAGDQSLIGQSGYTAARIATINGKTYTSKLSNSGSTPDNILYNVTVTEYQ